MHFLNPRTDFAFKKIFGSDQSQDILISLLNALLRLRSPYCIKEVEILDPYVAPKILGLKNSFLDVRAKDERELSYVIEMQVLNVVAMEKRVLYNACKAYSNQLSSGEEYHKLNDVVAITITDFIMFPEIPSLITHFKLREDGGQVYSDDLALVFAELPKFDLPETELKTTLDRWFFFLKHAEDLQVIPKSLELEPAIVSAFKMANKASLSAAELEEQERREIYIQDQRGAIELAQQQAREEGLEEGLEKGLEKGVKKGREEVALNMLRATCELDWVASVTGLDRAHLDRLRTKAGIKS